jgi:mono/diheme cytochrome c family protein
MQMRLANGHFVKLLAVALGCALLAACRKEDMSDQPKYYKPYKETQMFADGTTARPIPVGTIARGHLELEEDHYTGKVNGKEINYIPIPISHADLLRGQQRFMIYCAICHGAVGDGQGMIVKRGMVPPPSLVRLDRPLTTRELNVQHAPIGHYFDVITNGYGAMYSYNDRVAVDDRWRIAAYIRALQLSQDADLKVATMNTPPLGDAPVPVQANPNVK